MSLIVINMNTSAFLGYQENRYKRLKEVLPGYNFNFELSNKTGDVITVELKQKIGEENLSIIPSFVDLFYYPSELTKVQGNFPEKDKELYLKIWKGSKTKNLSMYVKIKPCNKNQCGKTVYLTLDKNGLREQKGTLGGLSGKTESGMSLKNNIKLIWSGPDQNIYHAYALK